MLAVPGILVCDVWILSIQYLEFLLQLKSFMGFDD